MGHALALVHALGGCEVALHDVSAPVLAAAPGLIDGALDTLVQSGTVTQKAGGEALGRIRYTSVLPEAAEGAELVVEAVVESAEVKRAVYDELDRVCAAGAVWASNTSYLDVFPLMPRRRQDRAAIAHWYTPPYLIDLVDLAPGPGTDPQVISMLERFYAEMGKAPVVFDRLVPGYVANRLQMALNLECLRMIEEGWAGAEEIDRSIRHGLVARMAVLGHMRKMDFTGLEMVRNGVSAGTYQPPVSGRDSPVLRGLIEAGRSGVRDGAGFYDYAGESAEVLFRRRDQRIARMKRAIADIMEGDGE
ncbi:hypothetical protein BOO69_02960 [Sulfitobacter alexandrii]|uniref:3-hydroxyacyl-CoA dehydrogenase family protein n=2 Tax=Sulfitobacter alexandrii TaxID=1917485 RepID=A0A1J0WLP3_9RHOB|nr:hypothetical protein BOO69_02960 [Sulfitobacter alexandrii]